MPLSRAQRFLERFRATGDADTPRDMLQEDSEGFGAVRAEAPVALAAGVHPFLLRSPSIPDIDILPALHSH